MTHPKAQLAMKNLGLTPSEYKNFLHELKLSIRDLLKEIEDFTSTDHSQEIAATIHTIKGNVGSFGFADSYQKCQEIETLLKNATTQKPMVLIEEFVTIYTREFDEIFATL